MKKQDFEKKVLEAKWYYDDKGYGTIWAKLPDNCGGDFRIADMRGWGHLVGQGGVLRLDNDAARSVQDKIGRAIVDQHNQALDLT